MKSKLKKVILIVGLFVLVCGLGIGGITLFSNMSSATIYDLRFVEKSGDSNVEIFEKDVYLTYGEDNSFDFKLLSSASEQTSYYVQSSDTSIASISYNKGNYKATYYKPGKVIVSATPVQGGAVYESFVLNVKENITTEFVLDGKSELIVDVYADEKVYEFDFIAKTNTNSELVNVSNLSVVDNYDKSVFKSVEIDAKNSKLKISADKELTQLKREIITIQSKNISADGQSHIVKTFSVVVNVNPKVSVGLQLLLSNDANFESYVVYKGEPLMGETKVENVYLSETYNQLFVKIRTVYSNGDVAFETSDIATLTKINDYYLFIGDSSETKTINVSGKDVVLEYEYLSNTDLAEADKFYTKSGSFWTYSYWDDRFKRDDVIIDKDGNIIGFWNWTEPPSGD